MTYEYQKPREIKGRKSGGAQKRNVPLATAIKSPTPVADKNLVASKADQHTDKSTQGKDGDTNLHSRVAAHAAGNMFVPPDSATWRTALCGCKRHPSCCSGGKCRGIRSRTCETGMNHTSVQRKRLAPTVGNDIPAPEPRRAK